MMSENRQQHQHRVDGTWKMGKAPFTDLECVCVTLRGKCFASRCVSDCLSSIQRDSHANKLFILAGNELVE